MTRREDESESEAERVFMRASEAEHVVARERDAEREAVSDAEREVVREAALEGINMFDGADDADEDDVPGHRTLESLDDFDIIDDEPDAATARLATARTVKHTRTIQSPVVHHHGVRTNALHMKTVWKDVVEAGDELAVKAPIADKSTIVCRTGMLMLASGTGAWRVRDTMNRVAAVLGITIHVDLSLLSFECTCIEGHHIFNEVVSLSSAGVNTHRIWMMESFLREIETYGRNFTVHEYHQMLEDVEHARPDYRPWQQGLAAGAACGAFVFLLGGGPVEMLCALVGAGIGNFVRSNMLGKRLGQFSSLAVGVAVACVSYLFALLALSGFDPTAMAHKEGYIGAMLFVIPGFPLITAGLDISKLDMRSGMERLAYAVSIIVVATLVGWMVAECVGLSPDDFAPQGLGMFQLTALRMVMSFVGVFGFSVMFNSPMRMAATAGCIGAVSNTIRLSLVDLNVLVPSLGLATGVPPEAAAFIGALISGLLASGVEEVLTFPRIALTVPSIVIMVPGLYLYRAMYYMCIFDTVDMLGWLVRAILIVTFLPLGLGIARTLTDSRWRHTS
ncbi:MAG: threonine/serine exporter family protein [Parolsenella sp.]|uniref:threonine/serine ThrE exporter family protein n=1 Tax=Parolsenella sp. TaxID=2083006 RepID=UPI002A748EEB|nr:threonine/serine exporter family protein [Parolsenella sp.]MCI5949804.1 threonine/serine exporter family protein [Coriobacteriaceae bacterium]MDY3291733.1 threonine/serine exporter family protein [Parolsenella sp.]